MSTQRINDFLTLWLRAQCAAVPHVRSGLVVSVADAGRPVSVWPNGFEPSPAMLAAAQRALNGERDNVPVGPDPADGQRIAAPLIRKGRLLGALVLEANTNTPEQREALQRTLEAARPAPHPEPAGGNRAGDRKPTAANGGDAADAAGTNKAGQRTRTAANGANAADAAGSGKSDDRSRAAILGASAPDESVDGQMLEERASHHRLATVVDLLATCVDAADFNAAALALCNELAARLGCERVSLGVVHNQAMTLMAMSHSAVPDSRSNLAADLRQAMSEAADQARTAMHPGGANTAELNTAQIALARRERNGCVLSLPLAGNGTITGALTLQRERNEPFDEHELNMLDALAALAGPLLALQWRDGRSPWRYTVDAAAALALRIAGPRRTRTKLLALAAGALLAWMAVVEAPYRVTAPAFLEGSVQRAVVAPLDGYVAQAHARAGDTVSAGDLIAQLDDRELMLERARRAGELEQLRTQYRGARAAHDRAEGAVINARIARAEAQVALLDAQLERTMLRAPIDGIIIAGDLSQLLGSPVARGDVLFEVAPLSGYRVVVEVDERDIRNVARGQAGQLALEGLADQTLAVEVQQTTPVSEARDGRNAFRVEARVLDAPDRLRPGMAGYARIDVGERRLLWIWTHRITDWLRLKAWTWWP